jgi:CRISPR-associated endonuclease Cas1
MWYLRCGVSRFYPILGGGSAFMIDLRDSLIPVITYLLKHNISILFLDYKSNLIGDLHSNSNPFYSSNLHKSQYILDNNKKLELSKMIIKEKINNQNKILTSLNQNLISQKIIDQLETSISIKNIIALEAGSTKEYWKGIKNCLSSEWNFIARTQRVRNYAHPLNAKDKFNSLLNYSYALLVGELTRTSYGIGFDIYESFMHKKKRGLRGFVYDTIEMFRFIAEDSCLNLSKNTDLLKKGFYKDKEGTFYLTDEFLPVVIDMFYNEFFKKLNYKNKTHTYSSFINLKLKEIANIMLE